MNVFAISALGGVLIGLSSVLLMAMLGRVAGISGIAGGLVSTRASGDRAWRVAFVVGLILAPLLLLALRGDNGVASPDAGLLKLAIAGLLVGVGTRIGGGCTSGHGVCGIARLSPRSFVATTIFIAFGIGVVFAVRHLGWGGQ